MRRTSATNGIGGGKMVTKGYQLYDAKADVIYGFIQVGPNRWAAGVLRGISPNGRPLIDDCVSPFNGMRFRTRTFARQFLVDLIEESK
jgi:hypothetical protein